MNQIDLNTRKHSPSLRFLEPSFDNCIKYFSEDIMISYDQETIKQKFLKDLETESRYDSNKLTEEEQIQYSETCLKILQNSIMNGVIFERTFPFIV